MTRDAATPAGGATPFSRVLVANRGEIALRVFRSARAMGYQTVAVYSSADAGAPHVRAADQAVWIGEAPPRRSYLQIDRIIEAAQTTGADAIHPGYGFLSENAALAEACAKAGLVFIGPSADAIRRLGDKAAAKQVMAAAGVPCVPGFAGADASDERLLAEARRIGFPVMIKAVAGGGGRGMRLVDAEGDFTAALRTARSEAKGAFGDDRVLIEKAIIRPRHIEIQVLGDRYGHAIHLGERDCSVQRRHQKLIEEAPSPAVSDALRQRMGAAATAAVQAIGYEGAGTLEFLLDDAGNFYFMEMNTRLQVEHPVTEAITGLDLVALQLRIAAGEPLDIAQSDVTFAGHAIELRLCAEDTGRNFMPQAGTMALWRPPSDLRVEHALEDGAVISPHYDSMIAKIIAHGATRDEARRRLLGGLNHMAALGVTTNRQMLARVLDHPVFARGGATTAFLTEQAHAITGKSDKDAQKARALACVLLRLTDSAMAAGGKAHALCHGFPAPLRVEFDDELVTATLVTERDGSFLVDRDGVQTRLWLDMTGPGALRLRIGTWQGSAAFARQGTTLYLSLDGGDHTARDLTFLPEVALQVAGGDGLLKASMSGQVTAVHVSPGDQIIAGQQLVTIEAMKMEHPHMLRASGTVGELRVKPGDQVSMGQTLLTLAD